jgi:hypothetical protein
MSTPSEVAVQRHVRAWIGLAAALGLHVADEALTGFLDFLLARMSDGSSRDVTSEARWSSGGNEVSVDQRGVVTGVPVGETLIRAQFDE